MQNASTTTIDEIADGIYRISTPSPAVPGGFSFNQYLIVDDEPLLFHTGMRRIFPDVSEAIGRVMPIDRLRYLGLSHFEADECGALNLFLAAAPRAVPICSGVAAMTSVEDFAERAPRPLADGETLAIGTRRVRWLDTPHLPHAWECGFLFEEKTRTLLCGDLFTQGGADNPPLTESDILGPSEAFRAPMDYFSHSTERERADREAGRDRTGYAGLHARQRLEGERFGAAEGAGPRSRKGVLTTRRVIK